MGLVWKALMSLTTLLLVRHAATDANLCKPYLLQGRRLDNALAEIGCRQAEAVGETLAGWPIKHVYSSPLGRALATAAAIARWHHLKIEPSESLIEVAMGPWEGLTWDQIGRDWPTEYQRFQEDPATTGYLGGESFFDVRERAVAGLEVLVGRHSGETIVAVSHNVVNRVVLAHWMAIPLRYARQIPQNNGGYSIVEFTAEKTRVRTINVTGHLPEALRNE